MSLFRDSPSHHVLPSSPSSNSTSTPISSLTPTPTKPRSSTVSRNDLFTTSWQPDLPPPRPLAGTSPIADVKIGSSSTSTGPGSSYTYGSGMAYGHAHTLPSPAKRREVGLKMDFEGMSDEFGLARAGTEGQGEQVDEFGMTVPRSSSDNKNQIPPQLILGKGKMSPSTRTSSFFDMASESVSPPPPAPKMMPAGLNATTGLSSFAPSPLTLSRSSSIRRAPPPAPLGHTADISPSISFSANMSTTPSTSSSRKTSLEAFTDPLSPLHQSPQLPPTSSGGLQGWQPPLPPSSDDVELRLLPNSTYLLGEGRYARVFLASYKRSARSRKMRSKDLLGRSGVASSSRYRDDRSTGDVNEDGDGVVGGNWKLCAAKRLAPDRESQTMGLREAFFLNRLANGSSNKSSLMYSPRGIRPRQRAVSPLRSSAASSTSLLEDSLEGRGAKIRPKTHPRSNGSVYVVKLIAVKEDREGLPAINQTHARSSSDALAGSTERPATATASIPPSGELRRQRSSTIMTTPAPPPPSTSDGRVDPSHLSSFPSLPSLAQSVRHEQSAPSLSRLVLLLEHAPLGTLDRMLRTSPQLVGRDMWERWAREGAEALEWVHGKGVVHADIKPGNMLLTTDLHIRLSDFGSSLLIHPSHPPTDGLGLGTLPFSPPELIDPNQTFSFAVDIFALGATLYQMITGREPFRGLRTIEMMHHVRKGALWTYEERERLHRVGSGDGVSTAGSPYPSAWRGYPSASTGAGYPSGTISGIGGGVRRAGSLRVPPSHSRDHLAAVAEKPRLKRMTSAESVRASNEASSSESPAGVKLWADWVKSGVPLTATSTGTPSSAGPHGTGIMSTGRAMGGPGLDAISRLLSDGDEFELSPTAGISRVSPMRRAQESKLLPIPIRPKQVQTSSSSSLSEPGSEDCSDTADRKGSKSSPSQRSLSDARVHAPTPPTSSGSGFNTPSETDSYPSSSRAGVDGDAEGEGGEGEDGEEMYMDAEMAFASIKALNESYADGSPSMIFLDGLERVSEDVREVLRNMLMPDQHDRMTARQVRERWDELGVGVGTGELD